MATVTFGTAATNTLNALLYSQAASRSDVAAIMLAITNDLINGAPIFPGAFNTNGLLFIPNRGVLQVRPGDYVCVGSTSGWPILISSAAASSADFIHA